MKDYEEKVLNIMDSAKNNIKTQLDKAYINGYEDGKKVLCDCKDYIEAEYNRGLNDAWECVKKILKMDVDIKDELFGYSFLDFIAREYCVSDVLQIIKEYEEQQKQDAIQVGDEVYLLDENHPRVVTSIFDDGGRMRTVQISENGKWVVDDVKELHRTGRTFPQIAEVLEKMRGGKE